MGTYSLDTTVTKNYKFGAWLHRSGDRDQDEANASSLDYINRCVHKLKNELEVIHAEFQKRWKAEVPAATKKRKDRTEDEEAFQKAWFKANNPVKEELRTKAVAEWKNSCEGASTYIADDLLERTKKSADKSPSISRYDGSASIIVRFPGGRDPRKIIHSKQTKTSALSSIDQVGKCMGLRVKLCDMRGREAKYVDLVVKVHRPFPEGSMVKSMRIITRRVGARLKHEVVFAVEEPATVSISSESSWVAVAPRWGEERGICKAMEYIGSDGRSGKLAIDVTKEQALEKKRQGICSQIDILSPQIARAVYEARDELWPEWLLRKTKGIRQSTSSSWILRAAMEANKNGAGIYLKEYRDLINAAASISEKQKNKRKDRYRKVARELCDSYDIAVVPNTNYAAMREKEPEDKHHDKSRERKNMVHVSPAMIRDSIKSAFGFNCTIEKVEEKELGEDMLSFLAARGEVLSKGRGVLANLKEHRKATKKREKSNAAKAEGKRKKKELARLSQNGDLSEEKQGSN